MGLWAYGALRCAGKAGAALVLAAVPAASEVTVAALGDSLTQGYGLPPEDGFVVQLSDWLRTQGAEARLVNAGVSGDTTAGGLARVDWTLTDDVDALIVALGGNDVLRGLPPEAARDNLSGILGAATARDLPVLLVGIAVPGNFGPDYKAAFEAIYPELAQDSGALLYPDFLQVIRAEGTSAALATLMQADGIHPNAQGVARIVDDIGPYVLDLIGQADP